MLHTNTDRPVEKYEIAPLALAMNDSFISICLAFGPIPPLLAAYRTAQHIIQAVPPNGSPLLQLPHMTALIAKGIEGPNTKLHMTVQQFMDMPEYQRRKLATDQPGVLNPKQYNDAMAVARQIPHLKVEKVFFKVMGEKYITTGSLVQFVVKGRVVPPGTANVPEVNELDLEDVDPDEGDIDAILGRKPPKNSKAKQVEGAGTEAPFTADEKPVQPPLAYAPYFARDHSPRWHLFLSESKQNRVAVPPLIITTFAKPIFEESGRPTFHMQTMKLQFQAPPQAGHYTFVMHLVCDSYIGMDSQVDATLVVEDSNKAVEMDSEDEISEPDEGMSSLLPFFPPPVAIGFVRLLTTGGIDSLAGQMNALKTGGLGGAPPKKARKRVPREEESSDDESDTEGEAGGGETSETDTDTDTDAE